MAAGLAAFVVLAAIALAVGIWVGIDECYSSRARRLRAMCDRPVDPAEAQSATRCDSADPPAGWFDQTLSKILSR